MKYLFSIPVLIFTISINAEVITDGTLGQQLNLPGPNFQITPDLGQQHGSNLFHSFQEFNLNNSESAIFSGPNSVQNILSRVTGGNPSNIDGLICSTILNADMYFLNPYGIMFGPNARLDVQGSFHASTADYLLLGEKGRFDAHHPSDSILMVTPIESFGFLGEQVAPISIQRLGEVTETVADNTVPLSVPEEQTFSLIGGEITLNKGIFFKNNNGNLDSRPALAAPAGRINLAAVAAKGEVKLQENGLDVSSFAKLADIFIKDYFTVSTDGEGGGKIFIRGKQLTQERSAIKATTRGDKDNALIDIQVEKLMTSDNSHINASTYGQGTGNWIKIRASASVSFYDLAVPFTATYGSGDAGTVLIEAPMIYFGKDSHIYNTTLGTGNAGNIILRASEKLVLEEGSSIEVSPYSMSTGGDGGSILVEAKDIFILKGAYLTSTTFSDGKGGETVIRATGKITLSDTKKNGLVGGIFSASNPGINMDDNKAGHNDGGYILIEANELHLEKGAIISSSTISRPREDGSHRQSANGGNIDIKVHSRLTIDGINLHGQTYEGLGSGIYVRARGVNTGDRAGHINIEAGEIRLTNGGIIASTTDNHAQGGHISIQAEKIVISGDSSELELREPADLQIQYREDFPDLNQETISTSGIYANSERSNDDAGDSGSINLNAKTITLLNGLISTSSQNAGGGDIHINTPDLLLLEKGNIITSVQGGIGDSGNITIKNPVFVVLNQGQIKAQADEGQGGNIRLVADQFMASPESLVSASSRLGIDGHVNIEAPEENVSQSLQTLPQTVPDASGLMKKPCSVVLSEENPSRFVVKRLQGVPPSPYDRQGSGVLAEDDWGNEIF